MVSPVQPQITVLDTGGQYAHLIARRVRDLGVYTDVQPSDTPASLLSPRRGLIISGGPASVYEQGSPDVDPAIFHSGAAVLGICYGHQLLAHHLGGHVAKGSRGEYGLAHLTVVQPDALFQSVEHTQIWMSHRDTVEQAPPGFLITAATAVSGVAAMADTRRRLFGLQFHPEVVHTHAGQRILENFVFDICGASKDWNVAARVPVIEEHIRSVAKGRNVFFFVSGGVDSTVAYTLCQRALGPDRVAATYVDTGLMREGETAFVREMFASLGATLFHVDEAADEFVRALEGSSDPESKRHAIGETFVAVQERVLATEHYLDNEWLLGQGTIYPDTIESAGTARADLIKTHHNRVAGIQALLHAGRVLEPLTSFYKDEVREIGRELGIAPDMLNRHPFPGPGLAIRCLGSKIAAPVKPHGPYYLLPVHSVGVQGDSRTYKPVLATPEPPSAAWLDCAPSLINESPEANRLVALCGSKTPLGSMHVHKAALTPERLHRLRQADAIVRHVALSTGFDHLVWQFPVILIPVGSRSAPDSVVLRPVQSADGMTANALLAPQETITRITADLLAMDGIAAVFYDLTHKPPGTIEWE